MCWSFKKCNKSYRETEKTRKKRTNDRSKIKIKELNERKGFFLFFFLLLPRIVFVPKVNHCSIYTIPAYVYKQIWLLKVLGVMKNTLFAFYTPYPLFTFCECFLKNISISRFNSFVIILLFFYNFKAKLFIEFYSAFVVHLDM